jgi:toxin ParE1/3/4
MKVVFSPRAARDLEEIGDYIAADHPPRAVTFVQDIRRRCDRLGKFPLSARPFPELGPEAHIMPYGNYVILYRALTSEVSIERVVHGARDIMALVAGSEPPGEA